MCEVCERARFWCIAFTPASKLALTTSIILGEIGITSGAGCATCRMLQGRLHGCARSARYTYVKRNLRFTALSRANVHGVLLASAAESR